MESVTLLACFVALFAVVRLLVLVDFFLAVAARVVTFFTLEGLFSVLLLSRAAQFSLLLTPLLCLLSPFCASLASWLFHLAGVSLRESVARRQLHYSRRDLVQRALQPSVHHN